MNGLKDLYKWGDLKNVTLNGIVMVKVPGSGIGVKVKRRRLKAGEAILDIPTSSARHLNTIPKEVFKSLPGASIQCLLASDITLDKSPELKPWRDALPSFAEMKACMPLAWEDQLQGLLPTPAREIVGKQKGRFSNDWEQFSEAFPGHSRDDFLYSWLLINSRTFYHEGDGSEAYPAHDRLALLPLADFFNHADSGCKVTYDAESYTITTDREYKSGEEIYISYGEHTNDFLLAEYGFIPNVEDNKWDKIELDEFSRNLLGDGIEQKLDSAAKAGTGRDSERGLLLRRWKQIEAHAKNANKSNSS